MDKKKLMWGAISIVIAILSVWAVMAQGKDLSLEMLWQFVKQANKFWLMAAVICMFGFIWFEGYAIIRIASGLGYKKSINKGTVYGAADVYFSSITPSASGGQPASAYFMMKDGIPGSAVTVILLINLIMYTLALMILGVICMIFRFDIFLRFTLLSKVLVFVGIAVMISLALLFYMLLKKADILYGICNKLMIGLEKIHLLRHGEKKRKKLNKTMEDYKECSRVITGKRKMLVEVLFWNIMQRLSQTVVSVMVFLAMGYSVSNSIDVGVTQCYVSLGSNTVPIPGAMGVADYLMFDGLSSIVEVDVCAKMELLCRGFTFYGCTLTSCAIVVIAYFMGRVSNRKKRAKEEK